MRGLTAIPSLRQLSLAYDSLIAGRDLRPRRLALLSQWTRFDPRLGELLVHHLLARWQTVPVMELRKALWSQPWPAAMGVLLEHVRMLTPVADRAMFGHWQKCLLSGVAKARHEQFFIGLFALGGKQMRAEAIRPLKCYTRWGYLGRALLVNKARALTPPKTWIDKTTRQNRLNDWVAQGGQISVADYRALFDFCITVRTAERDLASHPGLKARGFTRRRVYHSRP